MSGKDGELTGKEKNIQTLKKEKDKQNISEGKR